MRDLRRGRVKFADADRRSGRAERKTAATAGGIAGAAGGRVRLASEIRQRQLPFDFFKSSSTSITLFSFFSRAPIRSSSAFNVD